MVIRGTYVGSYFFKSSRIREIKFKMFIKSLKFEIFRKLQVLKMVKMQTLLFVENSSIYLRLFVIELQKKKNKNC